MKVRVKTKPLDSNGIKFGVSYGPKDIGTGHRGNLYVTRTGLVWCQGKKEIQNGRHVTWDAFIQRMERKVGD